ncbi:MAG: hypothetical protein SF029_09920 [bacterium]|nr:hypothetical protein [bacterium]
MPRLRLLFGFFLLMLVASSSLQAQPAPQPPAPSPAAALPESPVQFTPENIAQIRPMVALGYGPLIDIGLVEDGATLAAVHTLGVVLYDAADLNVPPRDIRFEQNPFASINVPSFTPGGATFEADSVTVIGPDATITVDLASEIQTIQPGDAEFTAQEATDDVTSAAGDLRAYVDADGQIVVEETASGEARFTVLDTVCAQRPAARLRWNADGSVLYAASLRSGGTVFAFDGMSGERLGAVGGFGTPINDLDFISQPGFIGGAGGSDQLVVTVSDVRPQDCAIINPGNGVAVFDVTSGERTHWLPMDTYALSSAVAGEMLAVGGFDQMRLYPMLDAEPIVVRDDDGGFIRHVNFSPDGMYVAAVFAGDNSVRVWETASFGLDTEITVIPVGVPFWGNSLAFVDDALMIATAEGVLRHDLTTGTTETLLPTPSDGLAYQNGLLAAVAPSLRVVESFPPGTIGLWDDRTIQQPLRLLESLPDRPYLTLTADAALLFASAPNGDIAGPGTVVLDTASGTRLVDLRLTLPITINASGTLLAAYSGRNEIELWGIVP